MYTITMKCLVLCLLVVSEYSLETVANSMPVFMTNVQCSRVDITLLDCSYSRNLSSVDHTKDLTIKCMEGMLRVL